MGTYAFSDNYATLSSCISTVSVPPWSDLLTTHSGKEAIQAISLVAIWLRGLEARKRVYNLKEKMAADIQRKHETYHLWKQLKIRL